MPCEAVEHKARPFMGICVGMQLMAKEGHEYTQTPGLGWIDGAVHKIAPADPGRLKIPHMGWNNLVIDHPHPIFDGVETGDHAYFVHSYQMQVASRTTHRADCRRCHRQCALDTMIGLLPPRKSAASLRMIEFPEWRLCALVRTISQYG